MKHDLPPLILANGMKLPAKLAEVAVDAGRAKNKRWQVTFGRAEEMENQSQPSTPIVVSSSGR